MCERIVSQNSLIYFVYYTPSLSLSYTMIDNRNVNTLTSDHWSFLTRDANNPVCHHLQRQATRYIYWAYTSWKLPDRLLRDTFRLRRHHTHTFASSFFHFYLVRNRSGRGYLEPEPDKQLWGSGRTVSWTWRITDMVVSLSLLVCSEFCVDCYSFLKRVIPQMTKLSGLKNNRTKFVVLGSWWLGHCRLKWTITLLKVSTGILLV